MSLLFDPRTNALAAYMMNLYDSTGATAANSNGNGNSLTPAAALFPLPLSNGSAAAAGQGPDPNRQLRASTQGGDQQQQQQAAMAFAAAAAQQAAAMNFIQMAAATATANSNSGEKGDSLKKAEAPTGAPAGAHSFRILDLLDDAAHKGVSGPTAINGGAPSLNAALQKLASAANGGGTHFSSADINNPFRLGVKRPFPGAEDEDGDGDGEENSPRSSEADTPNGSSSLNGTDRSGGICSGGGGGGGGGKKARKARTIFTDKQLQELEAMFDKHKYLSVQDRMDLAHKMGLTDTQVKTWYQNRRTKWKRQAAVGVDLLQEASNLAAVQNLIRTNSYWAAQYMTNPFLAQRLLPTLASAGVNIPGLPPPSNGSDFPTASPHPLFPQRQQPAPPLSRQQHQGSDAQMNNSSLTNVSDSGDSAQSPVRSPSAAPAAAGINENGDK